MDALIAAAAQALAAGDPLGALNWIALREDGPALALRGIAMARLGGLGVIHKNLSIEQQARDKSDANAHFRHALDVANEQVEAVQEIGSGITRQYLFETEIYLTREEAEEARAERVGVIARRFYQELPAALAGARTRGKMSARERASQKWRGRNNGETMH